MKMSNNNLLFSFFLLKCLIAALCATSFGGRMPINWTRQDNDNGYKLIGDMAYKAPSLKEILVCFLMFVVAYSHIPQS